MNRFCFSLILALALAVSYAKLPDFVKKCKQEDSACLVETANMAVEYLLARDDKKLKLQKLSELHIDKFALQDARDLTATVTNSIWKFEEIKFTDVKFSDKELLMRLKFGRFELNGDYIVNGKILILPIQGDGFVNVTFTPFDMEYKVKLTTEERKGKTHYKITDVADIEFASSNVKRIYYQLTNLFNGDKRLGDEMNKFLNENWKDVFQELREPIEKVTVYAVVFPYVGAFLRSTPIEDLFE